jgi:putative transposase
VHHDDPAFGYRFIADELAGQGVTANENRVARLCSMQQIWSVFAKKRGLARKAGPPAHDDLVDREFTAPATNMMWLTDITEHPTGEGKLYLCAVKDVRSNRIVGYSMDSRMTASLAVSALRNAIALRSPVRTIVHSDRGSQGEFKWLSQHLVDGGVDVEGARQAACCSCVSRSDPVAWSADGRVARGSGPVLGGDQTRTELRGCGGRDRRVARGRHAVVSSCWRRGTLPCRVGVGPLPVVS